jgi:hypothetical protein
MMRVITVPGAATPRTMMTDSATTAPSAGSTIKKPVGGMAGPIVPIGVGTTVGAGVGVAVGDGVRTGDGVGTWDGVGAGDGLGTADGFGARVEPDDGVTLGLGDGVSVRVGVEVGIGVVVSVGVASGVRVGIGAVPISLGSVVGDSATAIAVGVALALGPPNVRKPPSAARIKRTSTPMEATAPKASMSRRALDLRGVT